MVSFNGVIAAIFAAFFVFAGISLANNETVDADLKARFVDNAIEKPIAGAVFIRTLDALTPTVGYKLPFTDRKIFGINEFPIFGKLHTLFILFVFILAGWIMHATKTKPGMQFLVYGMLIVLSYFIANWLILIAYNLSSLAIGFNLAEATMFRRTYSTGFGNVMVPIIIAGAIAVLSMARILFKRRKNA